MLLEDLFLFVDFYELGSRGNSSSLNAPPFGSQYVWFTFSKHPLPAGTFWVDDFKFSFPPKKKMVTGVLTKDSTRKDLGEPQGKFLGESPPNLLGPSSSRRRARLAWSDQLQFGCSKPGMGIFPEIGANRYTPWKINMEPLKMDGLEDDFPDFNWGWFLGSMLIFRGVPTNDGPWKIVSPASFLGIYSLNLRGVSYPVVAILFLQGKETAWLFFRNEFLFQFVWIDHFEELSWIS